LADEQRIEILLALKAGEEPCERDILHVLGASVSVASDHLGMEACDIVGDVPLRACGCMGFP